MTTIKPFSRGFFAINNAIFDVMMPELSHTAFKVLCCAVRLTQGWHKESDVISYTQFQQKTGIKSRSTISKAIQENLEHGYLIRVEQGQTQMGTPNYAYILNTDLELVLSSKNEPMENVPSSKNELCDTSYSSKNGLGNSPENELYISPKNGHTKEQEKTSLHDADDVQHTETYQHLRDLEIDAGVAQKLAQNCTIEQVSAWVEYIKAHDSIKNRHGFLVSKLRQGEFAPEAEETQEDDPYAQGTHFRTCKGCFNILHINHICPDCGRCWDCCECEAQMRC